MATPEQPADPPIRVAWMDRGSFGYTDEGEGPTVVAIHGIPGTARDYRWLASSLGSSKGSSRASGVRLIRLELPGFGHTPRATGPDPRLEARARFVVQALDALGLDEVVVLGHSMGGPVAASVAAAIPERVRGLALLASVGHHPHRLMLKSRPRPDVARLLDYAPIRLAMLPMIRRSFVSTGFPSTLPDESMVQSVRVVAAFSFESARRALRAVRCPTFLAWADDDRFVEPAIGLSLSTTLPDGPRLAFAEGGHNIQKTQAVELAAALRAWSPLRA